MPDRVRLDTLVPAGTDPDDVYDAFSRWAADRGVPLYPHQDEAVIELLGGNHVVLATPTGSGKSMVAIGAHAAALARDEVSFYTAPIKALVSEKFFALIEVFGADNVGMLTGDAAVNPDAPIICCTAEVLANIALREGGRPTSAWWSWTSSTSTPRATAAGPGRCRCSSWWTPSSC